jgi:hypothetical protein
MSRREVLAIGAGIALIVVVYVFTRPKRPHGFEMKECDNSPLLADGSCRCPKSAPLARFIHETRIAVCNGVDSEHNKCNSEVDGDCNTMQVFGGTRLESACSADPDDPCTWTNLPQGGG